jgi:hypothetical protein
MTIKTDLQRITPALDALQRIIDSRKAEAVRVGAVAGGRTLPPSGGSAAGGGHGEAQGSNASSNPPPGASLDTVSSVQGLSHSDAVLSGLKGQLLGVAHSLKGVAAARSETLAKSTERRQMFGGGGGARDLGRPLTFNHATQAQPQQPHGAGGGDTVISMGGPPPPSTHNFQTVTQAQLSRDPELAYINSRAQDVAGLESTINELGSLFGRLASLVAEQGAVVERIDADLEAATTDLERGTEQLQVSGCPREMWGTSHLAPPLFHSRAGSLTTPPPTPPPPFFIFLHRNVGIRSPQTRGWRCDYWG